LAHRVAEPDALWRRADTAAETLAAPEAGHLHRAPRHAQLPADRITTLLGRKEAVVMIHGGIGREERLKVQEAFKHDPRCRCCWPPTPPAKGINLQRAHLMVNYDLPWNPNRLEQRFGRIHRIGQTEVCHLWNLVADDTREGDVYRKLLEKLEQARQALGGQVFDVLGKLFSSRARSCRCATC
jgi:SNF2 family DNA or RNA helicase